ncbi:MAG TPA: hypothetical protein VN743_09740 [Blastocatellia bacterium]|jgi:hypothetical protein|nr:hypothetical protein [Blastocatellia bacterium]
MEKNAFSDSPLWKEFQKVAREKRRNPVRLLTEYMRECLETWEDQKLDEEIQRDVRRSGFREEDAVDIVRRHRLEKKSQRATS